MCYVRIDIACKGGGVRACQDGFGLGYLIFHVCLSKAICAMPMRTNTFKKGAFLIKVEHIQGNLVNHVLCDQFPHFVQNRGEVPQISEEVRHCWFREKLFRECQSKSQLEVEHRPALERISQPW